MPRCFLRFSLFLSCPFAQLVSAAPPSLLLLTTLLMRTKLVINADTNMAMRMQLQDKVTKMSLNPTALKFTAPKVKGRAAERYRRLARFDARGILILPN